MYSHDTGSDHEPPPLDYSVRVGIYMPQWQRQKLSGFVLPCAVTECVVPQRAAFKAAPSCDHLSRYSRFRNLQDHH